jgi:hypothetical protein
LSVTNQAIANWPPDAALWLVWQMTNAAGNGQGLAIDDLTFSASSAVVLPPPTLSIQQSGFNVLIAWPATTAAYTLQQSANLAQTNGWANVTQSPALNGGTNTVTLAITAGAQFFRLWQ